MLGNTNTSAPNNAVKVEIKEITFTANGDYSAPTGYYGFNPVHVNVTNIYDVIDAYFPAGLSDLSNNAKVIINPTTSVEKETILQDWKIAEPIQANFTVDSLIGFVVSTKKFDSNENAYYNVKTLLDTNT